MLIKKPVYFLLSLSFLFLVVSNAPQIAQAHTGYTCMPVCHGDTVAPSVPVVTSSTHPSSSVYYSNNNPSFSWSATDNLGLKGYSWAFDQSATTNPSATTSQMVTSASYSNVADGTWYFHVKAQDIGNNWSGVAHFAVKIDTTGPSGSVSINNGAVETSSPDVNLGLSATDALSGVSQMRIAQSSSELAFTSYKTYSASDAITLSAGNGVKTVYVQYKDAAGNESVVYSASIILNVIAPIPPPAPDPVPTPVPGPIPTPDPLPVPTPSTGVQVYLAANAENVRRESTVTLTGALKDGDGQGLAGQVVKIKANGKVIGSVKTDNNGRFIFKCRIEESTVFQAVYTTSNGSVYSKSVRVNVRRVRSDRERNRTNESREHD